MTESRTTFSGGAYTSSWTSVSVEWANCQCYSATENTNHNKKQQYTKWKIIMRQNSNITNKNRLIFDSRILHIESVIDYTARNRMIEVTCREEVI